MLADRQRCLPNVLADGRKVLADNRKVLADVDAELADVGRKEMKDFDCSEDGKTWDHNLKDWYIMMSMYYRYIYWDIYVGYISGSH